MTTPNFKPTCSTDLPDVDASILLSLGVSVPQFSHDGDGVESGILGQRVGNDLHCLCKTPDTVRLHPSQTLRVGHQLLGHLDLRCTSSGYQSPAVYALKLGHLNHGVILI